MEVKVKLLDKRASIPEKATEGAAGYDIRVWPEGEVTIGVGEIVSLPTGIAIEPDGRDAAAILLGRSGLGTKHGITLANCVGLIDSDYRGEIRVSLINRGSAPFTDIDFEALTASMRQKTPGTDGGGDDEDDED